MRWRKWEGVHEQTTAKQGKYPSKQNKSPETETKAEPEAEISTANKVHSFRRLCQYPTPSPFYILYLRPRQTKWNERKYNKVGLFAQLMQNDSPGERWGESGVQPHSGDCLKGNTVLPAS